MDIQNLAKTPIETYYDPAFVLVIESHLTYLRQTANMQFVTVTDHEGYKYEGDFYGLLAAKDIPFEQHLIALRMNGLSSSADYDGLPGVYKIPTSSAVNLLRNIFETNA